MSTLPPPIRHRLHLNLLLPDLGRGCRAAEVGVAEGRFSLDMLAWGLERLYLVDAWTTLPQRGDGAASQQWHEANLAQVREATSRFGDRVQILRGRSVEMATMVPDGSLHLVHLDADHERDAVAADLLAWWPKIVPGGVMSGHDYLNQDWGVGQAVDRWAAERGVQVHLIEEDRSEDAGFWMRVDGTR